MVAEQERGLVLAELRPGMVEAGFAERVLAFHQAPTDGGDYSGFHCHIECHPPLRKPHLLKYLAGPEIGGGNFLSDTRPEAKAAELLGVPDVHYRLSGVGPHA